jgi:tetratricopeptide (TPR) repeat protein
LSCAARTELNTIAERTNIFAGLPFGLVNDQTAFPSAPSPLKAASHRPSACSPRQAGGPEPAPAAALNGRGLAYKQKGDFDLAIRDLDEAIRIDPGFIAPIATAAMPIGSRATRSAPFPI